MERHVRDDLFLRDAKNPLTFIPALHKLLYMNNAEIKAKLEKTKITHASITVLSGSINIATMSDKAAKKWAALFALMFPGSKIQVFESSWEPKDNRGGFGSKLVRGWRAAVAF